MTDYDDDHDGIEYIEADDDDGDDIRKIIRDEIEAVLRQIPGEGSVADVKRELPDPDEPLTLRALENSVRKIVEDAMVPLREAKAKPKPKPKAKPAETEPEPAPVKVSRSKLTSFLWGEE
jgi:hypothetical protein